MKTIHPLELEALIETNQPVEILDLRARMDFEKRHILGAHSLPATELTVETLVHSRELPFNEPLYVTAENGLGAQMAAENMEQRGLDNLVVIEGGMQGWERYGLPVEQKDYSHCWRAEHRRRMVEWGMATDVGVAAAP